MSKNFRVLGVVPVRGGSKGVPRKNIRPLGGRPLLAYTLRAAENSTRLADTVVSSEDPEILRAAERLGARVLVRPEALAGDDVPMAPVIQHAARHCEATAGRYDAVFTLQVTTPFRTAEDVDAAVSLMASTGSESVIGVVRIYDAHPVRVKKITTGRLQPFCLPEDEASRRQDLEPAYLRNGAVYLTRRDVLDRGTLRGVDQCPYEMPAERSINIDEPLDFLLAEAALASGLVRSPW